MVAVKAGGRDVIPACSAPAFLRAAGISAHSHHLRSWSDLLGGCRGFSAGFAGTQGSSVVWTDFLMPKGPTQLITGANLDSQEAEYLSVSDVAIFFSVWLSDQRPWNHCTHYQVVSATSLPHGKITLSIL